MIRSFDLTAKFPLPLPRSCYSVSDLRPYLLHLLPGETKKELFTGQKKMYLCSSAVLGKPHTTFFGAWSFLLQI